MIFAAFLAAAITVAANGETGAPQSALPQSVQAEPAATKAGVDVDRLVDLAVFTICPEAIRTNGAFFDDKVAMSDIGFEKNDVVSKLLTMVAQDKNNVVSLIKSVSVSVTYETNVRAFGPIRCSIRSDSQPAFGRSVRNTWKKVAQGQDLDIVLRKTPSSAEFQFADKSGSISNVALFIRPAGKGSKTLPGENFLLAVLPLPSKKVK